MKIVLEMSFLIFSNINIKFVKKKLIWKLYTTKIILPNIYYIKFINKLKFAKVALDENIEALVMHISFLN